MNQDVSKAGRSRANVKKSQTLRGGGQASGGMTPPAGAEPTPASAGIQIEIVSVPSRGGKQAGPEKYPFSKLEPCVKRGTELVGPSFVISMEDNPDNVLAAARKRYKGTGKAFISRKMDDGVRVWLAPEDRAA